MASRSFWTGAQTFVLIGGATLAVATGFLAWRTSGDLRGPLVAATAALAGGSLAGLNGLLQQLAERRDRQDTARRAAYQDLLRVLTTYNGYRRTARLWWERLQSTEDEHARELFSTWGLAAYEQAQELSTQLEYAMSNARIGAGSGALEAIDTLENEFGRTREVEMGDSRAELDLKHLQDEMAKEIDLAPASSSTS